MHRTANEGTYPKNKLPKVKEWYFLREEINPSCPTFQDSTRTLNISLPYLIRP